MKLKSKLFSVLMTVCFLAAMIVPTATPALASGDFQVLSAPNVSDGGNYALGGVLIKITAGSLEQGDTVTFRLPDNFAFLKKDATTNDADNIMEDEANKPGDWEINPTVNSDNVNQIVVPETYAGDPNALWDTSTGAPVTMDVEMLDDNEFKLKVTGTPTSGDEAFLYLYPKNVWVEDGFDGPIDLVAEAPSSSGFPSGTVTIGNVTGGKVTVSVSGTDSFTDNDEITIRVTEDTAGALDAKDETLKIKLPSGFAWSNASAPSLVWGDANLIAADNMDINIDGDELTIDVQNESDEPTSFKFNVRVNVDDETDAKTGEVVAKVSGESDVTPTEVEVGSYGTYESAITAGDPPTIFAGMLEQPIAPITISESVKESLMDGRTLTLELPENARWGKMDSDSDSGLRIDLTSFPGKDGKTAKFTFSGPSTDAAKLVLDDLEVSLEPGVTGDLKVKVGGTAGLSGELTVAKIVTPITVTGDGKPEVKIGTVNKIGDVVISETEAGAIKKDKWVLLDLPTGVRFANKPTVEVIEGDLNIDTGSMKSQEDDNQMTFYVDGESSTPSKIKISNINYVVDRTVAEGDIVFKVKGSAVSDVNDPVETQDYYGNLVGGYIQIDGQDAFIPDAVSGGYAIFSRSATNASCVNATVVTPAPTDTKSTASFVIGSTTYKVNGVEATMDVAPYLKSDRTFLPVRYVANALGVADANIMWNASEQSVVILKGDRVIKLTIGSNTMLINGVPFTIDVAPEIVDPGRTMLPLRAVAQALGADVQWDAATQTVTINTL